ncbi:transposase family protein [Bradyrhizobium manausense]|uniref:DDE-type integrase/transposase/recombinase n=1 Tax=Bradyrhizobium manausense TaxID=989370 RepID=UPI001BA841C3|nr:DDE-type integrase/transposase/recombinase [Bradyrhizobium manausense]MBR0689860.1 transposase family protein [Bradyrhizobium manausense]
MANIERFRPKPVTLAIDYGTPILRPGARLEICGVVYRLIQRTASGQLKLENVDTNDVQTLVWAEIIELWKTNQLRVLETPAVNLPPAKVALSKLPIKQFSPKQRGLIKRNKYYCTEVEEALKSGRLKNTSSPNIDIFRETLEKPEGYEKKKLLSRGQIQKIYWAWKASGERDSVLAHGNCGVERKSTLHDDVIDIIHDVIDAYLAYPDYGLENLQSRIAEEINRQLDNGELVAETEEDERSIRVPSLTTIAKYKERIERYVVVRVEDGEYEAQLANAPKGKLVVPAYPGARWELDHALVPIAVCIECIGPNGEPVRIRVGGVWVTIVIDVATRFIVAMVFGIDPPSSERTLAALKLAMTSKADIFDKYDIENRLDVTIVPSLIVFDNGKDLHAKDVMAATGEINVRHAFAGAYHGDHKPYIERFIRTLKAFFRKTRAATKKGERKSGPKRADIPAPQPIPLEEVERIAWKFVMDTYHIRKHAGLYKDKPANVMKRGLETLMASRQKGIPLPFRNMLAYRTAIECDAIFGFRLTPSVDSRGIRYKYLWWNSGELARLVSEAKCDEVDVRLNPANLGSVLAFHPVRREWIEVPSLYPFYTEGLSLWFHKRILSRIYDHERKEAGGKLGRNFVIDLPKYLKNEGELLAQLIDLAGLKQPSITLARTAARYLGSKLDFALGVARMDAIDIQMGQMPPGYGTLIDLKKAPNGIYYAESKPNPRSKNGRFDYRAAESLVDPEAEETPVEKTVSQTVSTKMTTSPIAGFDPNQGFHHADPTVVAGKGVEPSEGAIS